MEKLIILLFGAFITWHSSRWLSETLHAVIKDIFPCSKVSVTEQESNHIKHHKAGFNIVKEQAFPESSQQLPHVGCSVL